MYNKVLLSLLVFLIFSSCKTQKQAVELNTDSIHTYVADADVNYLRSNDKVDTKNNINDFISPFREEMAADMNTVLGIMPQELKKSRPNSSLGNWFCDALLVIANKYSEEEVDFAFQNYGGLRIPSVSQGPVTKGKIFELMPFDNKLVILKLKGETLTQLFNEMADSNGWPISKNLSFKIHDDKAIDIIINDAAFDKNKVYNVALTDYIANGGGDCHFLKDIPQFDTGIMIREAIIEYLEDLKKENKPITVDNTKRILQ